MKTNTKIIFILSLISLAVVSYCFWYVRNSIDKKINVVSEYRLKEIKNQSLETSSKVQEKINILNEQEDVIKRSFLNPDNVVNFVQSLESNALGMGLDLSVEKIDYGVPEIIEQKYNIKPIIFNLQIKGSFTNIESFLDYLKNSEDNLSIREYKIYKNSGDDQEYSSRIIISGIILSYE